MELRRQFPHRDQDVRPAIVRSIDNANWIYIWARRTFRSQLVTSQPMDQEVKDRFFLAGHESPGSWLLQALRLRAAANRIDERTTPVRDDEPLVSFLGEYHMLLGLAFENLLKGYITLLRLESGMSPALPKECFVHKLEILAARPECSALHLSEEEIEALARLSPYIEWAGRYPLPKRSSEMISIYSGSRERTIEQALWDRLVPLLHERAWVMKGGPSSMGGIRLNMTRREQA